MAGSIRVTVNFRTEDAVRKLKDLGTRETDRILNRALNRAAVTVRAEGARAIAQDLGGKVNIGQVRRAIFVKRSTTRTLTSVVAAVGKQRIPLTLYNARQTKTGVRAIVAGKSVEIPHAFIRKVGSGKRKGVLIRSGDYRGKLYTEPAFDPSVKRKPVAELFAPGVPAAFVNDKIIAVMKQRGTERFLQVIDQEYRFALSRL